MYKVLITGIDGFTGQYIEQLLEAKGYEVHGTCFSPCEYSKKNHHCLDVLNLESARDLVEKIKPQIVIHLAAISFADQLAESVERLYATNVVGTRHLLYSLAQSGHKVEKVILASSGVVYGNKDSVLCEKTSCDPYNDYGVSKLAMESMAKLWMDKLPITITRPFNYTGVGQDKKFLVPKLVAAFKEKKPSIQLGNVDVSLDISDVRFIAQSYVGLIEHGQAGEVYNLSSGQSYSIASVINQLSDISGHSIEIQTDQALCREKDTKKVMTANKKLLDLPEMPSPIAIKETLQWMLSSASLKKGS